MRFASFASIAALVGGSLIAACSSTTGSSQPGPDGGTSNGDPGEGGPGSDAGADVVPGFPNDRGPGVFGALPSGYCCTKDSECKDRACIDVGGGERMCLDICLDEFSCDVPKTPFGCKLPAGQTEGKRCSPPAGFKCMPQGDFVRGSLATGDCCAFQQGQKGGSECASHVCGSFGDGPYMCLNHCAVPADCPPGYKCEDQGGGATYVPTCLPIAVYSGGTYTCK